MIQPKFMSNNMRLLPQAIQISHSKEDILMAPIKIFFLRVITF